MASADFAFLMKKEDVADEVVAALVAAGITSVKQLAVLAKDAEDMRSMGKDLGIGSDTLAEKVKMTKLFCAFNSAKARAVESDKADAEALTRNLPKTMPCNDFQSMRTAFQAKFWKLADTKTPAQTYV